VSEQIPDQAAVVGRARSDATVLGELCQRYAPLIYRFIHERLPDRATAEDLTSDVFHRAVRAMDRYGPPTPFGSLLYSALTEVLVDEPRLADGPDSGSTDLREAEIDPGFQRRLAAGLAAERVRLVAARRRRRWRLPLSRLASRPRLTLGVGAASAAAIALLVVGRAWVVLPMTSPVPVTATAAVGSLSSVDPASTVSVDFSRPMDRDAVVRALRLNPATAVRTAWRGNRLLVTAVHGFTPNSPYVITIDRSEARTASGVPLRADLDVVFGTAPLPSPRPSAGSPAALPLTNVAAAAGGSRAVITADGAVVVTSASAQWGAQTFSGLISFHGQSFDRLGPPADAICVSRSGRSLAYLSGSGPGAQIVVTAWDGAPGQVVSDPVDDGSPLGWIGDGEVLFVSGGHLEAVDRGGRTRSPAGDAIDAAHDTLVMSPGGRYVFLRAAGAGGKPGQGRLLDLVRHSTHQLAGIVGEPAFSADGATTVWIDGSGPSPRLDSAPSGGGPVLSVTLPVAAGDRVGDLAVAPDGGRLAYSLTRADGSGGELRVADLNDGATLAASAAGAGRSPSWSPAGDQLAFLGHPGGQPEIQVAAAGATATEAVQGSITRFADAQVARDGSALHALSDPGLDVDDLPQPSRVVVVQVVPAGQDVWRATLRVLVDPIPADPEPRSADEWLLLRRDASSGAIVVANVSATSLTDVTSGPHVVRVQPGPKPGSVTVTFDADLDASSVPAATAVRVGGRVVRVDTSYDASTRTVTVGVPGATGLVTLVETTTLRDIAGQGLWAPFVTSVTVGRG
jgi:DNA-directed RNA polymerase specialized sigma24 family protein